MGRGNLPELDNVPGVLAVEAFVLVVGPRLEVVTRAGNGPKLLKTINPGRYPKQISYA